MVRQLPGLQVLFLRPCYVVLDDNIYITISISTRDVQQLIFNGVDVGFNAHSLCVAG